MRVFNLGGGPVLNQPDPGGGVVAIGNFDGVHLGHRTVIDEALQVARQTETFAAAMTFEPYPREFFSPEQAPPRLTSFRHKSELLQTTGIERVYCVRFGRRLASTTAEAFIQKYLLEKLSVRHVIVGSDFRFGARRVGDIAMLQEAGSSYGFGVTAIQDYLHNGVRVSSSSIRELLSEGHLSAAAELLGRPFSFMGRVIHGDKRGRTWGFPTANFAVRNNTFPLKGVYVVCLDNGLGLRKFGVANAGMRPTVSGTRMLVEVHLFNFNENLYGKRFEVMFHKRIRDERKFPDFEALKRQIFTDIEVGKSWLAEELQP